MYHEVGIQKLSENQLSKLRNGHPVRVKLGNHHKICLSVQQLKKLHKASKKGSASTISFDPYQLEAHGSGILGDIGRKAKAFIQKYKLQDIVNPVINRVKKESHKGVSKLSNYAHSKINELQPVEQGEGAFTNYVMEKTIGNPYSSVYGGSSKGEGVLGDVLGMINPTMGNVAKTFGLGARKHNTAPTKKTRTKKGKGIVGDVLGMINPTMGNVAKTFGLGVARKHSVPKKPRTKKGKGIVTDLAKSAFKSVAKKGIEMGADYLQDKVSGMGGKRFANVRRVVGRRAPPAKRSFGGSGVDGGALYPGGYGGGVGCC